MSKIYEITIREDENGMRVIRHNEGFKLAEI